MFEDDSKILRVRIDSGLASTYLRVSVEVRVLLESVAS